MQACKAAADGCVETVRLLLKAGADKEELNTFGATPLYMAACRGNEGNEGRGAPSKRSRI